MSDAGDTHGGKPPPELFRNVIRQLREHWVDSESTRQGVDPESVTRALIVGNSGDAEVRIGADVRAVVYLGDDRIVSLDEAVTLVSEQEEIRGLVPDVPPDAPFSFFDLDLGYLVFDLQPRREWAKRHLEVSDQFRFAAGVLIEHGGFAAACENMFAAAELAAMALMEASNESMFGHPSRSKWLIANGPALGLSTGESQVLASLLAARNVYRYGDATTAMSAVDLLDRMPDIDHLIALAREVIGDDPR